MLAVFQNSTSLRMFQDTKEVMVRGRSCQERKLMTSLQVRRWKD